MRPMRDHLAADFGEAAEAAGDVDEAVGVELGDVAGDVPAVVHDFGSFFGLVHVALHDVGAFDQQHAGGADRQRLERLRDRRCRRRRSGTGRPTEPSLQSISALCERLAGTLTDTSGESSVVP